MAAAPRAPATAAAERNRVNQALRIIVTPWMKLHTENARPPGLFPSHARDFPRKFFIS